MQKFFISFAALVAVAQAGSYAGSGYGAIPAPQHSHSAEVVVVGPPAIAYNIPPPSVWNPEPGPLPGPILSPVNAHQISGSGSLSSLIGLSSSPSAAASAISANQPLPAGKYTLLVVPSYEVPNAVVNLPVPSYGGSSYGSSSHYGSAAPAPVY